MTARYPSEWESDVVLRDGGTAHVRPIRADDGPAVLELYTRLSDEGRRLRFFTPLSASVASTFEHVTDVDYDWNVTLVAELGPDMVAIARYDRKDDQEAEIAFTVRDDQQGRGLGTVMLEQLAAIARTRGIRTFHAEVLGDNQKMLHMFRDAGFETVRSWAQGNAQVSFAIAPTDSSTAARLRREHTSEAHSVARMLAPSSIAVIGASRTPGTIGHGLFRNLLEGGFTGPLYPVNPNAAEIEGVRVYPSIAAVPGPIDLALIAVPAPAVLAVARECADKGVLGLVVISAGFSEVAGGDGSQQDELVELARRNGMRIIGPNCMGVVNTNPRIRMNGTFAPFVPPPGRVGFASQSGGLGIGLLARAQDLGLGISTFVSMGNKADVSGNDLLQYWEEDPDTDVVLLYLESFGNPRKFGRLARRISRDKPIVAVKSGRSAPGARGAASHTAALASPDLTVDALFRQAGVIRVDTLEELFDTATLLAHQPLPAGRRVAIVSNGGGPGILAADACVTAGLEVPELSAATQQALRDALSPEAGVRNPVDLVASASATTYDRALDIVLRDADIDMVLVIFVPVNHSPDVERAIVVAAGRAGPKPVVACLLDRSGKLDQPPESEGARSVPTFAFPEGAARALGRAADHAAWCRRPEGVVPALDGIDTARARGLVEGHLARYPEGERLGPGAAEELLECFGIPVVQTRTVASGSEAVAAADAVGYPVTLKAASGDIVHKSDVGAVRLDLATAGEVVDAYDQMYAALGDRMGGAVVQPMVPAGVETIVGVTRDAAFGSLVLFGIGGVQAELLRDSALRLVPVTDVDAHELVRELRTSPLLFAYRNTPQVDVDALEDLLMRVGQLADHLPEVAELDCNPVIVSPSGVVVVDAKLRLVAHTPELPDDFRRMRTPR